MVIILFMMYSFLPLIAFFMPSIPFYSIQNVYILGNKYTFVSITTKYKTKKQTQKHEKHSSFYPSNKVEEKGWKIQTFWIILQYPEKEIFFFFQLGSSSH